MLLINPPIVRVSEPPPGIIRIAGFLRSRGIECRVLDACAEGIQWLLNRESGRDVESFTDRDTWTRRAVGGIPRNLRLLKSFEGYENLSRYSRAVFDLQRVLNTAGGKESGYRIGLANYEDDRFSSLSSTELTAAARGFRENPFYPYYAERIPEILGEFECGTVGISLNFLSQAVCAFALIGYLKEAFPGLRILLGGGLVTSWIRGGILPQGYNFSGFVDALLPGRGEDTLMTMLKSRRTEKGERPSFYEVVASVTEELPLRAYLSPGLIFPWNFSFGCAWKKCTFCPEKAEDSPFYFDPPSESVAGIDSVTAKLKPALLHLTDNEIPPVFLKNLISRSPEIPWYGFVRFSSLLEDPGFCRELAASGCAMLQLGLESGDQAVLDGLNKGIEIGRSLKILKNLKKAGIGTYVYLLFGTPAENSLSARRTMEMVKSNAHMMDFLNLAIFNLPVSSELAAELDTGSFYEGNLSLYSGFRHPDGWGRGEVRRFLSGEFSSVPEIRRIVKRTPPVFTSSHAPFFSEK